MKRKFTKKQKQDIIKMVIEDKRTMDIGEFFLKKLPVVDNAISKAFRKDAAATINNHAKNFIVGTFLKMLFGNASVEIIDETEKPE